MGKQEGALQAQGMEDDKAFPKQNLVGKRASPRFTGAPEVNAQDMILPAPAVPPSLHPAAALLAKWAKR